MTANPVANFADYKKDLEDLHTRFQYNKVVGHQLMSRAMSLERAVRGSVLILLAISLFTGAFPILNGLKLTWIWATATISGYFADAPFTDRRKRIRAVPMVSPRCTVPDVATEVEFFSFYVKQGKIL
jgi:hypothetical protein